MLPGVTREKVIQISKKLNFKVIEKNIKLKDINKYDECFVTATGWGICSVKSINRKIFYNRNNTIQIQKISVNWLELILSISI